MKQRQDASGIFGKLPFVFKIENGKAEVNCLYDNDYRMGYLSVIKFDAAKIGDINALKSVMTLGNGSPKPDSCLTLLSLLTHNPLKVVGPLVLNIDKKYEELLELDKREGDGSTKTEGKKEGHTRLGNLLKVMKKTLGLDQYGDNKPQEKDSKDAAKGGFMDSLWGIFPGGGTKTEDKKQTESKDTVDSSSSSNALAVVNVDSKNFEDTIDEGFQKGVDDFYALAKASCYSKAITAVKAYSSCLIRGKETGGTEGCLKYHYHSEDLLEFCEKSFTYETNTVVDKLIINSLAEAQKIEYNYENQKLLAHSDSTLFEAASNKLLIANGEDAEDILTDVPAVACVGGQCGAQQDQIEF